MTKIPKRPEGFDMGHVRVRVKRGPDAKGRWYWTYRETIDGQRVEVSVGWYFAQRDVEPVVLKMLNAEKADSSGAVHIETVKQMMGYWLGYQEKRRDSGKLRDATYKNYAAHSKFVVGHLGDIPASRLRRAHVEDMDTALRASGRAATTARVICVVASMAQPWAIEREHIVAPPIKVRGAAAKPVRAQRAVSHQAIADFLAAMCLDPKPWLPVYAELLAWTGARPGEVALLRPSDFSREFRMFVIPDLPGAKTGSRRVALPLSVARKVAAFAAARPADDRLFPLYAPNRLRDAMKAAGISWSPYALRKSRAEAMVRAPGASPRNSADFLGHSADMQEGSYLETTDEQLLKMAELASPAVPVSEEEDNVVEWPGGR